MADRSVSIRAGQLKNPFNRCIILIAKPADRLITRHIDLAVDNHVLIDMDADNFTDNEVITAAIGSSRQIDDLPEPHSS